MKVPARSTSASDWDRLVAAARDDTAPPVALATLLRAVRLEPYPPRPEWVAEFLGLFAGTRALATCVAGIGGFALLVGWQAWTFLDSLPWAQLLDTATGGGVS